MRPRTCLSSDSEVATENFHSAKRTERLQAANQIWEKYCSYCRAKIIRIRRYVRKQTKAQRPVDMRCSRAKTRKCDTSTVVSVYSVIKQTHPKECHNIKSSVKTNLTENDIQTSPISSDRSMPLHLIYRRRNNFHYPTTHHPDDHDVVVHE